MMRLVRQRALSAAGVVLSLALIQAASAAESGPNTLSQADLDDGWILLFDGESLFGWKAASKANWQVAGGAITASQGEPGLLCTTSQFGDYVLKVDFRAAVDTNSGVFLRTSPQVAPDEVASRCYEVNIADPATNKFPTGSLAGRAKADDTKAAKGWRTFEITADRGHITVVLDGREVLQYTDPKPLGRGFIGLQLNSGKIEFRNIKLKPLGIKSLFNGKDLSGWKTYPELPARFSVTPEGWLNVKGGRGPLESRGQYADFTMQLEVFVNGKALNSGVFFRAMPGDPAMNGYEVQIQNGFLGGDRTKPQDCGTGGIFRRQDARRVLADDFAWFPMTIHADGRHVAAWVNGVQVSDWTDTRKPDSNPRKGLRLESGTIMIQGHDPTTDLSFRNLRIAELPKR
jgi:hypothetical protein